MLNFRKNTQVNTEEKKALLVSEKENWALRFIIIMAILGIVLIILFSIQNYRYAIYNKQLSNVYAIVSVLLFMGGASFALGSFLGFLFGIPRSASENTNEGATNKNGYIGNDNLLQVSDWLTKIIVGVGLTQLYNIPSAIRRYAEYLNETSGISNVGLVIFSLIYFAVFGFLLGYLWTRLYFVKQLRDSDYDLNVLVDLSNAKEDISLLQDYISTGVQKTDQSRTDDDPQKNQWGGSEQANGRIITAKVTPSEKSKDFFNINLEVKSIDPLNPLVGDVKFYLHPSFRNPNPTVISKDGVASLNLLGWGAFTVGAECDNGQTKLEIDLSQIADAPQLFKSR